ncbi:MAG: PilN domain-containing protein [Proteobacteria bacterium]|nr:PilN domain-containing protein [Pseudomonadota bacterium]MBU2228565.1 PilN domain-containing protein [Pseudomonadota bacterium]MBU2261691.1 PilN domain-containing protein [Pseudomonadota bacterium]
MIKINLLPYREKEKKENIKRQIIIISGSLLLFILILLSGHIYINMTISDLEKKIKEAEAKLVILDKKVGDIEDFKKDKKELEQKLAVINTLEVNRFFPVRMLDELNMLVPTKDLWLDKVAETGRDLRIEGVARDNGILARFMRNLERAGFVQSVDLVVSKEKDFSGVKLQQFVLTCVTKKGL